LRILPLFAVLLFSAPPASTAAEPVDYLRDVKPLLTARCYACHSALKQESELRPDREYRL